MIHSDTSSLFLNSEGPPFHVSYSPGVCGKLNTKKPHSMFLLYSRSQMFLDEMLSNMPQHTLPLNALLMNVAHTLIIHVKDLFLLGVSNCQDLIPPSLFDGWTLPLGKSTIIQFSSLVSDWGWRTRSEGQETKERLGRSLWLPSTPTQTHSNAPSLSYFSCPLFHIQS